MQRRVAGMMNGKVIMEVNYTKAWKIGKGGIRRNRLEN